MIGGIGQLPDARDTVIILAVVAVIVLAVATAFAYENGDMRETKTVDSIATGMLYAHIVDYEMTRNSHFPSSRDYPDGSVIVAQILSGGWDSLPGLYHIYRPCIYFDTSFLGPDAKIESAKITMHCKVLDRPVDFDVVVQNGQPEYPHYPMEGRDYYRGNYTGNGGSLNTAEIIAGENYNIPLNADGLSWINKTGITKLFLRSSRDIEGIPPLRGANERVLGEKWAKLTITYTVL